MQEQEHKQLVYQCFWFTPSPGTIATTSSNEYDGSTWAAGGNLGAGTYGAMGCGTQTSALAFRRI
jgi:hypothetical protein